MEERSDYSIQLQVQLQEEEVITEGELLQVAMQYACANMLEMKIHILLMPG